MIVTMLRGLMTEDSGFDFQQRQRFWSFPKRPDRLWGSSSQLFNGHSRPFPQGYSGRGLELITKVKNAWHYTYIPLYTFIAWPLVMHRNNYIYFL